jgi:hypothetical protein
MTYDVNGDVPKLGLKGKLSSVDPGRVFTSWIKRNPLQGRGELTVEGSGTGAALPAMISNFAGRGTFRLIEHGRLGLDLKALTYAAQNAKHVGWAAAGKGSTALEQLELRYSISNGALTLDHLHARSGTTALAGSGKVDVRDRILDVNITSGQVTPGVGSLPTTSAKTVLVLRGDWNDPAISIMGSPFTLTAPVEKNATEKNATILAPSGMMPLGR